MPIKTLHITNSFHQTSGGISTFYRSLLKAADRLGRKMALVVPSDRTRIEDLGAFSRVYYVEAPQAPFFDRRYRLLMPHTYLPGLSGRLKQILLDENRTWSKSATSIQPAGWAVCYGESGSPACRVQCWSG